MKERPEISEKSPKIPDAPGLTWRRLKHGWECRWRARTDLVGKGYIPAIVRLFAPTPDYPEPGLVAIEWIQDRARALQDDMLTWGNGGIEVAAVYGSTWRSLIDCYKTDPDSTYKTNRYNTRKSYDDLCKAITLNMGDETIEMTDARRIKRLYETWSNEGKFSMGHSVVTMIRILATFGSTLLKCKHCRELKLVLHDLKFKNSKQRDEFLTREQAIAIRGLAPSIGRRSIALAQAFQFDLMLRQKDVIGEWVPISEAGISAVHDRNEKWLRGIRWEEIDQNLRLKHITSKRDKPIDVDLTLAQMVIEELRFIAKVPEGGILTRDMLPATGPVLINEQNDLPWQSHEFRRKWRDLANGAGVPKTVRNMDSRAGAITEATDMGIPIEKVKHAAHHSNSKTTERYARGGTKKTADVMRIRGGKQ